MILYRAADGTCATHAVFSKRPRRRGWYLSQAAAELMQMAQDYRDIAEDLENGAIEIRHPERMPQRQQQR
jgi:hypothetical protein